MSYQNSVLGDALTIARSFLPGTSYPYSGSKDGCPVCGELKSTKVSDWDRRLKRLETVACVRCGLLRTNPMPTAAELSFYYKKLYRFDYQLALSGPSSRHVRKRSHEAARRASAVARWLKPGASTLDFGAGSGEFVAQMLAGGMNAHGFEPGETYAQHAQQTFGYRVQTASWEEFRHPHKFDMVSSFHVFEHLRNPVEAMRAAASWLKDDGLLYIELPDAAAQLRKKGFGSLHFAHVVGFNRYNLEAAAGYAGFVPVTVLSPTRMIFRRTNDPVDCAAAEVKGRAATEAALEARSPRRAYVRHHLGKVGFQIA